jgi:hypothetical protein
MKNNSAMTQSEWLDSTGSMSGLKQRQGTFSKYIHGVLFFI